MKQYNIFGGVDEVGDGVGSTLVDKFGSGQNPLR